MDMFNLMLGPREHITIPTDIQQVWIIGAGMSLDKFDMDSLPTQNAIIITMNSVINLHKTPHYQVASDARALSNYYHVAGKDTIWISRPNNKMLLEKYGLNYFCLDDVMQRKYMGSGSDAICLAYELTYRLPSISSVHYVGLDQGSVFAGEKEYRYANKLQPYLLDYQQQYVIPKDWVDNKTKYTHRYSKSDSYQKQLRVISEIVRLDKVFRSKLVSHSFLDLSKLDPCVVIDCNWRDAKLPL